MLKECLGISKQTWLAPNKYSVMVPFINFYLHPENQNRYASNEKIPKIKEYFNLNGWEHFPACQGMSIQVKYQNI